ncbi:MAG TPA: hypothetical protein VLA43_11185 [Longimicrobiales bacterium]|nr:hypothetical protein [Longimicrobiales bacterium]
MRLARILLAAALVAGAAFPARGQEPYRSLEAESVLVTYLPADSILARRVLGALREMPPLPGLPGVVPEEMEVVLAGSPEDFAGATGGQPPHWSAGVALPDRGRIVLPAWSGSALTRRGAAGLLRHEWAHLAVYRGSGGRRAPRWFTEGYAEWTGGWDRSQAWRLRVLLAVGRAPALDSLTLDWPGDRVPAESAYLLAASVVEYLVEASGERGLETLFQRWREAGRFEEALRRTYGLTSGQLEDDWRRWARERYGWLFVMTHSSLAWGLLALLLALTALLRRRHNRERMARLRAREIPETPAYWAPGEPPDGGEMDGAAGAGEREPDPPGPPGGTS